MKKTLWCALGVALFLLLATAPGAWAQSDTEEPTGLTATLPESEEPLRLHLVEDNSGTQFLDLRSNGEGPGDLYLWNQNPLTDADTGEAVGTSSGFCINTVVSLDQYAAECAWTLVLADGTLHAAGTSYNDGEVPITGGTGAYFDARGTLRERFVEESNRYEYVITLGPEPAPPDDVTMRLVEDKTGTRVIDLGEVGNSPGDMYLWNQNALSDANSGEDLGTSSGYCIVTTVVDSDFTYECAWTLTLAPGSLYVAGTSYDEGDLTILGGTGAYAGATGILSESYDSERKQFIYTIRLGADAEAYLAAGGSAATDTESNVPNPERGVRQPAGDETLEAFWDAFDWNELTTTERDLWGILGWDQASWDGYADAPLSEGKSWDELTEVERAAAQQLGYDQETWDATAPEG